MRQVQRRDFLFFLDDEQKKNRTLWEIYVKIFFLVIHRLRFSPEPSYGNLMGK